MTAATNRILKYKEKHPEASLRQIGKAVNTSHEYVRLVLKKNDNTSREKAQRGFILSEGI
tara:strand:- start:1673 stop:1852 length:180 start_codon:yes stop_codon:yes gene_type:complete